MGKHLSIEEKSNATEEVAQIKAKIRELRHERKHLRYLLKLKCSAECKAEYEGRINAIDEELEVLRARRTKLDYFIESKRKSPYGGMFYKQGVCYKMFGKKKSELTPKENTEYSRVMKEKSRAKKKERANETH